MKTCKFVAATTGSVVEKWGTARKMYLGEGN
jgi:hypothetical protein